MIRTFTYEDYKVLEKYEEHLVRAKFGRYIYALRRPAFEELSAVYRSLGYTQRLDYSCSSCLLNLCITLGNYYFDFKKQLEAEQKNEEVNEGYGIKDEGTSYPVSPAQFDCDTIGEPIKEPQEENEEENPNFTEEDLEKAADEINEAIIKDIVESHKEPVTATKTNNTKTKKTNTRKKK
jgi:hypothetical protein